MTVWLGLFASVLIMTVFIKEQGKMKSQLTSFILLAQLCLEQGSNSLNCMKNYSISIFIVLFIWMICSAILTKCFTSILLETYFIRKPSLAINTLDDILNDPDISVTGKRSLNILKSFKPEIYDILIERLENYENKLGINTESDPNASENEQVIKDIMNRKAVLLASFFDAEMFELIHPYIKKAENIYYHQHHYWYVSKSHPRCEMIYKV